VVEKEERDFGFLRAGRIKNELRDQVSEIHAKPRASNRGWIRKSEITSLNELGNKSIK
jgi:hypothetical protein